MIQPDALSLLFVVLPLFVLMAAFFYRISRQIKSIDESIQDIAKSQRIMANNPKDFEETKRINALKKSPYD